MNTFRKLSLAAFVACLPLAASAQLTMNIASPQQTVDGFGAAASIEGSNGTVNGGTFTDAQYALLYDPANGIGLNIMRIGITNSDGSEGISLFRDNNPGFQDQMVGCLKARRWQPALKVIAEPSSANNACKSNGSIFNGGTFLTSCNSSWSTWITNAATTANLTGCPLYAVALQNEPDFSASTRESMTFTPAALTSWCDVLCPALAALTPPVGCHGPELAQWVNMFSGGSNYTSNMLADSTCLNSLTNWTTHAYGTPFGTVVAPAGLGSPPTKRLWMTEFSWFDNVSNLTMTGTGGGLASAVIIHNSIVTGQASAVVSWFGVSSNNQGPGQDDGLIEFGGNISKRLYVLGQYSKFVRPGMVVFPLTGTPPTNVLVSSFKDGTSNNIAVVAINNQASTAALTVTLDATSKCQVVIPWVTDASNNIVAQSPVNILTHVFSFTLGASSVTTFTCNGT